MKLDSVDVKNRENLKVNKDGDVLCPKCNKDLAWVTWGNVTPCTSCEKPKLIIKSQG